MWLSCAFVPLFYSVYIFVYVDANTACTQYETYATYSRQSYGGSWWRRTKYRTRTNWHTRRICCTGYGLNPVSGLKCYPLCDGKIATSNPCNLYNEGHVIMNDDRVVSNSGGSCEAPNKCVNCNEGYYSDPVGACKACPALPNCDIPSCSAYNTGSTCERCSGTRSTYAKAFLLSNGGCEKACSWRYGSRCFPGTCVSSNGVYSSCQCASGFSGLDCTTFVAQAEIKYHELKMYPVNDRSRPLVLFPANTTTYPQQKTWTNENGVDYLSLEVKSSYSLIYDNTKKPFYVQKYRFGVDYNRVTLELIREGSQVPSTPNTKTYYPLQNGIRGLQMDINLAAESWKPFLPFEHGDLIKFIIRAANRFEATFHDYDTSSSVMVNEVGEPAERTFDLGFDLMKPEHCRQATNPCDTAPLTALDVTGETTIRVSWDGWVDNLSGVDRYEIQVIHMKKIETTNRPGDTQYTIPVLGTQTTADVKFTTAGLYGIYLHVYDKASNYESARRFTIFDDNPVVEMYGTAPFVPTAAEETGHQWINKPVSDIKIDFNGRYKNIDHSHRFILGAIEMDDDIRNQLDDSDGIRTLEDIQNNNGIVRYEVGYRKLKGTTLVKTSPFTEVPGSFFDSQTMVVQETLDDGIMLEFDIRGYDILEAYAEDTINITVDFSPPEIAYIWLTDGEYTNISVHSVREFTELTIEWEVADYHSGLDSVRWRLFDNYTRTELEHGVENLGHQGETTSMAHCETKYGDYARGPNCYCTPYSGCYHRHFQYKPVISTNTSSVPVGLFPHTSQGIHERDYFIELTVTNKAFLASTKTFKLTVDTSAPVAGHVLDGINGQAEVDFQQSRELHAHWYGFFDKESGVKFYRYGISTACLQASVFELNSDDKGLLTETTGTSAIHSVNSEGTYFITVAAYNHAIDPSDPVCSDGVTVDTAVPTVSEFVVDGSKVKPQVLEDDGGRLFYLHSCRVVQQVEGRPQECVTKATATASELVSSFPQFRFPNGTIKLMFINEAIKACTDVVSHGSQIVTFLQGTTHLTMSWNVTKGASGVHDFYIGVASTESSVPDREDWSSTHHHQHARILFPNVEESDPFYILIKSVSKAETLSVKVVGPFVVDTTHPDFNGAIIAQLNTVDQELTVTWETNAFVDPEDSTPLHYQLAIGTPTEPTSILPYSDLSIGRECNEAGRVCVAIPFNKLHWDMHGRHVYTASVKGTNTRGLSTLASSEDFTYNVAIPSVGVLFDVQHEDRSEFQDDLDIDFQTDTSGLSVEWSGFKHLYQDISYRVCVAETPSTDTVILCEQGQTGLTYTFNGLSLEYWKKYYQIVIAETKNGNVSSISDGVTIIDRNSLPGGILVFDGLPCSEDTANESFGFSHHTEDKRLACEEDTSYQASTSGLSVHWEIPESASAYINHVLWGFEERVPIADHYRWEMFRDFESVKSASIAGSHELVLQPGLMYRAVLMLCVDSVCYEDNVRSDGVVVIPNPPITGAFELQYNNETMQIIGTLANFRDPDVDDQDESLQAIDHYEWALTDNSHDGRTLTTWERIENESRIDQTSMSFTVELNRQLDFKKCLKVAVRGYSKAGLSSVVSSEIRNCSDVYEVKPSLVIDAVGRTMPTPDDSPVTHEGQTIVLNENAYWKYVDQDYTPFTNIIAAVWPTLRYKTYTWAVVEYLDDDPLVFYKNENDLTVRDPCSHPDTIRCGTTDNEYINVLFRDEPLTHGTRYLVCIHANATTLVHEKWSQDLPEFSLCSDGITVDITPPETRKVWIGHSPSVRYQTSTSDMSINWESFEDIEEGGIGVHSSGIAYFMVAIGTSHGGVDIMDYVNVGLTNHAMFHGLSLQSGHTYFASVKGFDFVNNSAIGVSMSVKVDTTPPTTTQNQIKIGARYITDADHVSACWEDVFSDTESGIARYEWSIGSKPGLDDISPSTQTVSECEDTKEDTVLSLKEGHIYFISVKAFNNVGMSTLASSWGFRVDISPPETGSVYEGTRPQEGVPYDEDYFSSKSEIAFYWDDFHDPHTGIQQYYLRVGTQPGEQDILASQPVGLVNDVPMPYLNVAEGIRYYFTVVACNVAALCTSSTSDGFILDRSRPTPGRVLDGFDSDDIQYQASRIFLGAKWFGFADPQSGLANYVWRVGRTPGADDILPPTDVHVFEFATELDLQQKHGYLLPINTTIYITVRAYNKAGKYVDVKSNGFIVDTTGPVFTQPVSHVTIGSIFPGTSVYRTLLRLQWEVEDPESAIDQQYISLTSHIGGDFNFSSIKIEGVSRDYTLTGLQLHDGSYYDVTVISCNRAKLCSKSKVENILVDSTKPTPGTFACTTDHAMNLYRQPEGWMKWATSSIRLSWLGFSDVHSEILHYVINVGSSYMMSDLNKVSGVQFVVQHNDNGFEHEEGPVQTAEIPTVSIMNQDSVFVSIYAVNKVGLPSEVIHSEFILRNGWIMDLVRRCNAATCYGHCVCAPHGQRCPPQEFNCRNATSDGTYSQLAVADYQDLTFSDGARTETHIPQATVLAGKWSIINSDGQKPLWYEWSVGETTHDSPVGVFNQAYDRVWHDAGQALSWMYMAPQGSSLDALRVKYSFFVRTWYDQNTYAVFKSPGVTTYPTPPKSINIHGASVKETFKVGGKDVDFFPNSSVIIAEWTDKFLNTQNSLWKYHLYISTYPGGHDIHVAAKDVPMDTTVFKLTGLSFHPGITYYTVVQAYNYAGLHSTEVSDGFTIDTDAPSPGIVFDGEVLRDIHAQSSVTTVPSFWHSFSDTCSGIKTYGWCLSSNEKQGKCDITSLQYQGLTTHENITLDQSIPTGTIIYNKVLARDGVGHSSLMAVSNGVIIDDTPPLREDKMNFFNNVLQNPSFETDEAELNLTAAGSLKTCTDTEVDGWNVTDGSCVVSVCDRETTVVGHGRCLIMVKGSIQQTIHDLVVGDRYRVTISAAHPHLKSFTISSNEGFVSFEGIKHVYILYNRPYRSDIDGDHGGDPAMISWHKHTYYFTVQSDVSTLEIGSANQSSGILLDNIKLEKGLMTDGDVVEQKKGHVTAHTVYVHDWSSVHASWGFVDPESGIKEYFWAIGTVEGGTQLQNFISVGLSTFAQNSSLRLIHNSVVYVTVMAVNGAGLRTVSYSDPIHVDLTPPVITQVFDGTIPGEDTDFQSSNIISATWVVVDKESGITDCSWAVGTLGGLTSLQDFLSVGGEEGQASVALPMSKIKEKTVYVTVRCGNNAGQFSTGSSDGVTIMTRPPSTDSVVIQVLGQSLTEYPTKDHYHGNPSTVRFRWTGFEDDEGIDSYIISLNGGGVDVSELFPGDVDGYVYASFQNLDLADGVFTVSVIGINKLKMYSTKKRTDFTLLTQPPTLTGSDIDIRRVGNPRDIRVSWGNVFQSLHPVYYEVNVGQFPGNADIIQWQETQQTTLVFEIPKHENPTSLNVFVSVRCITYSGKYITKTTERLLN